MISTFSAPVLSIAADAVRDLEGGEALFGLWKLFTKCKESLQDGRRLENISWRMWYREMAASHSCHLLTPETSSSPQSESRRDFPFFQQPIDKKQICHDELLHPRTRHSTTSSLTASRLQHGHSSLPQEELPIPSSCLSLRLSISFGHLDPSPPIGKFIVDMLPNSTVSPVPREFQSNALPHPLVTPPLASLPIVCLPSTPPAADAVFPRVVVVNPTPHPTPPATPTMTHTSSSMHNQLPSTHLLPPPLLPVLVNTTASIKKEVTPNAPLSPPRASRQSKAGATADETLKASDRRFFLQQSPERESPERDGSTDGGKVSDVIEASSCGSSRMQVKGSAESDRPIVMKATRKGKEVVRHMGVMRPAARRGQIARPPAKRQLSLEGSKHKPTFNIGSSSSNGSKGVRNGSESSSKLLPPPARETTPPKRTISPVKATQTHGRRIIVASSASSDYETTDTDDDSWCSEEVSTENEKTKEENRLREAVLEAQRQRDMFAKVPKRSYSNLNRTRSGLLSALLNPDPNIFPPSHPYRTSYSSQDVTQLPRRNMTAGFTPMPPLATSKSTAALPQAARITARAPSVNDQDTRAKGDAGYQPKGRPQGQEMEEDTESDDENTDDRIQVSRSIAQERLAALVGRRNLDRTQSSRLLPQPAPVRPSLPTINSTPIPFGHPYNLPAPAPPSTPRTTRRQMLATELSESLRRNLLWERQVSKNLLLGQRRQSTTALGGLRPLTSTATAGGSTSVERSTSHQGGNETAAKEERKRRAMARNRSWAEDYHYAGW